MVVTGHKLVAKKLDLVDLLSLVQNPFECIEIRLFLEDFGTHVSAIESMVQAARFIGSGWSWHRNFSARIGPASIIPHPFHQLKRPDPFSS